jgi:hypothetical protein
MQFEINVIGLEGQITAAHLVEHGGTTPINIISASQDFDAHVEWYLCAPWPPPGDWLLRLHLESMGTGTEYDLPTPDPAKVATASGSACTPPGATGPCQCWTHDINVAAGTVDPGAYSATVVLTWESAPGTPGPMAGFADLGKLQIYVP